MKITKENLEKLIMEELMLVLKEQLGQAAAAAAAGASGATSGENPQLPARHQSFRRSADAVNDNFNQIHAKLDLILSRLGAS